MRDQLNGQLYDAWRADCDAYDDWCYVEGMDAYTHNIIPVDEDAVYERYEDRLAE